MVFFFLAVALAFGALGYYRAASYEKQTGIRLWTLPPALWGLIFFGSLLIGTVLFAVATSQAQADDDGVYDAVARVRPMWMLRTAGGIVLVVVGLIMMLGGGSGLADGDAAGGLVLLLGIGAVGAAVLLFRGRRRGGAPAPASPLPAGPAWAAAPAGPSWGAQPAPPRARPAGPPPAPVASRPDAEAPRPRAW